MKRRYTVAALILIAAAAVCATVGVMLRMKGTGDQDRYEEIRNEVKSEQEKADVKIPIDFASLQEINPDVYAWITIPGTSVDYPVLQSPDDNSRYLTHTIDGKESAEGALYTELYNSRDFQDPNTVIYGHDMRDGSMFGSLLKYMDRDFFDRNRDVTIYTPDAIRHYRIYAAYVYDNRHLMQSFDFTDRLVYTKYLERIRSIRDMNANIDTDIPVDADDKIITLSTCYNHTDRYLVQAVLESVEQ